MRRAVPDDEEAIVALADQQRQEYRPYAPTFSLAAANAPAVHPPWIAEAVEKDSDETGVFVHVDDDGVVDGFVIATLVLPPPVYAPSGPTCSIDDFVVADPTRWPTVGFALFRGAQQWAFEHGAVQTVVVCSPKDLPKRQMLIDDGLYVATEWLTAARRPSS